MQWYKVLTGYLDIALWGDDPERVINMAMARGIRLWDIRQDDTGSYRLKIRLGAYRAIRQLARRCRCRIKTVKKYGVPFYLMWARKRRILVAGTLFFFIMLYILASFVWFIEVKGNNNVDTQEIMRSLKSQGLKVGIPKSSFVREEVEDRLLLDIPELAWAGIEIRGSRVIVEVAEKTLPPTGEEIKPADIIAAREGIIEELLVLRGTALVKEGDRVLVGQSLVAGMIYPEIQINQDGSITPVGEAQRVRALALVRARVQHAQIGECLLKESIERDTGKETTAIILKYRGWDMTLRGPRETPYEHYRTVSRVQTIMPGRIPGGPVELITVNYLEQVRDVYERSLEEAYSEAVSRAKKETLKTLPPDCRIIKEEHELIPTNRLDLVRIKYSLETIEDIGTHP